MKTQMRSNTALGCKKDPIAEDAGPDDVVAIDDPASNFLLVAEGGLIDLDLAEKFGLIDSKYDADKAEEKKKGPKSKAVEPATKGESTKDDSGKGEGDKA